MSPVYKLSESSITGRTNYGSMLAGNPSYIPISFESIATVTVGSGGAADIEFTSIPSTYKHLQIRGIARNTKNANEINGVRLQFNADTGSNYVRHSIYGDGSGTGSTASTSQTYVQIGQYTADGVTAGIYGAMITDILDYTDTNKNTTVRSLDGNDRNGAGQLRLWSGLWIDTDAITSIKIFPEENNFKQYTQFALYGIKG